MGFFDFIDIYSAITISIILYCIYSALEYKSKFLVWRKLGVKGPTPLPYIGTMYIQFFKDLPSSHMENIKQYGRFYGIYEGPTAQLVVTDPKIVKQVTVKDFHIFTNRRIMPKFNDLIDNMITTTNDSQWKRLRKVISPTFTSGKIKRMQPFIEQCIRNGNEFLEMTAENNELVNLKQFWSRFTLEVITCCCFARDINSHKDPNNIFFKQVTDFFKPPSAIRIILFFFIFLLPKQITKLIGIPIFPKASVDYLTAASRQLLIARRSDTKKYDDFLELLLEAERETEDTTENPLTELEIIANCILFFVAGYETTATMLTWCTFILATHPEIQEKLFEEMQANIENVEKVDYETTKKLQYLDAFVCETLRMYPPVAQVDRMNSDEVELEGTGLKIPPKTLVSTSVYAMHHDPELYPEPEKFIVERFIGENRESIDPYAYLPFGAGPRNCVAMRFALFEAKLALIKTLMKFKFIKSPETPIKPMILKGTAFMLSEDIFVNIQKR